MTSTEERMRDYRKLRKRLKNLVIQRKLFSSKNRQDTDAILKNKISTAIKKKEVNILISEIENQLECEAEKFLKVFEDGYYPAILRLPLMPPELVVNILSLSTSKTLKKAKEIQKRKASTKGRQMAKSKSEKSGIPKLKTEIQKIWASGHYSSRDLCAEQEWAALGFGSISTARKALRNTPEPPSRC